MHRDDDGTGKGDGLVTYLKQPSVDLAIQILDGTPLRDGDSQTLTITQAPPPPSIPSSPPRLLHH